MTGKKQTIYFNYEDLSYIGETNNLEILNEAELSANVENNVVGIYPSYKFQTIEGFGCALTESACYLMGKLSDSKRKEALECWFGDGDDKARFIRIPIDSCDYSLEEYQAVEHPLDDPELKTFSLKRDKMYVLPIVKEAVAMSKGHLSALLSPWSPPADWKTPPERKDNDAATYGGLEGEKNTDKPSRCFGGHLKKEYYASWAKYLVKYVQAYLEEGVPVTMLSVQNEASAATSWDSCVWTGEEEKTFLRDYLYPAMKDAGLTEKVEIFIWDHNKERMIEHIDEMMDDELDKMVSGFAYHWYSGDHFDALSMMHQHYPDKILMHSESCGLHVPGKVLAFPLPFDTITEEVIANAPEEAREFLKKSLGVTPADMDMLDALNYAHDIIGDINHGMQRWIDWNLMVDRTGGPRHVEGGFAAPIVYEEGGDFTKTLSYGYLNAIMETIPAGSVRLGLSSYADEAEGCAVERPDGSIGILLLNRKKEDIKVNIRISGKVIKLELPKETLSTLILA